jgi:hypothetical protein
MIIGYFSCKEQTEQLRKKNLKGLINFQKTYPNAVILNMDINMTKNGLYDLECYRLSKNLMDLVDLIEVEEDEPNIFKKFTTSEQLLTKLNFTIKNDVFSLVSKLTPQQLENKNESDLKINQEKINNLRRM